jgi:hypothetical protein
VSHWPSVEIGLSRRSDRPSPPPSITYGRCAERLQSPLAALLPFFMGSHGRGGAAGGPGRGLRSMLLLLLLLVVAVVLVLLMLLLLVVVVVAVFVWFSAKGGGSIQHGVDCG